ncbi:hypothetical protein [Burkholderia gladioli]|uniref:hypothetical protein n=1 Tax=Burkholderia gladioli TaxID=28095 RepID=UPI0016417883|nr:hypothetical protein [Burkholderia gladioli]
MTETNLHIYRINRSFKTYGIRPFVLVTSITYGVGLDATLCAEYLILHANGEVNRKLGGSERLIRKTASVSDLAEVIEQAALDDAFDLLTSDAEAGSEAISGKFATPVTQAELLAARMRGAIAAPVMADGEYLYPLGDVIQELKAITAFKRS